MLKCRSSRTLITSIPRPVTQRSILHRSMHRPPRRRSKFARANDPIERKACVPSAPLQLPQQDQSCRNTPITGGFFCKFPDACTGLIMLQGNMESTSFLEGSIRNFGKWVCRCDCRTATWAGRGAGPGRGPMRRVGCLGERDTPGAFPLSDCRPAVYQVPVLGMLAHGSAGGRWPSCSNSTEMPSGVLTKAMWPSRGGRWTMCPASMIRWQVS